MGAADYSLVHYTPGGSFLTELKFSKFSLAIQENQVGNLTVTLPPVNYPPAFFQKDSIIEVWRTLGVSNSELIGKTFFMVRRISYKIDDTGQEILEIQAVDTNDLLRRRIVPFSAGSIYTTKIDFADDILKDFILENYGVGALDTARDLSGYIEIEADQSAGPIIAGEYSWKNILDIFNEIVGASQENGIRIVFAFERTTISHLIFRTFKNYRGTDHSQNGPGQVFVSWDFGNLSTPEMTLDFLEEVNYVYVGGQSVAGFQSSEDVSNLDLIGSAPYARCEFFLNQGNTSDSQALIDAGNGQLFKGRPRIIFTGSVLDNTYFQYGVHYTYGDLVMAQYRGYSLPCRLDTMTIDYDSQGGEQISLRMHGEIVV